MRIPQETIDQIRESTDIVEYIGGYVKLKKRGKNYLGLCPFHSEKTPSFNVSSERQMYHCFGCGVGGNVFTFVMERDKVSFIEAVRALAERAGIALPTYSREQDEAASEQELLYQTMRLSGLFYHQQLTDTAEGKFALDYFHNRGFSDDTIRSFGLGYAPNTWEALFNHLKEQNVNIDQMQKCGLIRKREDGSIYDYFRGRAMFPIFSNSGRVIGFGARKLYENDPLGKYINSPETAIYNKSKVLYGISQAKETIREKENAILVEGYADLISVFQAGVKNIVASSGTALTVEQIQLVRRYTNKITIVYDADSAGSKAALRGVDLILENDMDVRVAPLPEGDDPDSFVRKNGGAQFQTLINTAESFVDFLALTYERQGNFKTPEGQAHAVRSIIRTIAKMGDELKRNFYIKQVAEKYKLYESTLYRELDKQLQLEKRNTREFEPAHTPEKFEQPEHSSAPPLGLPPAERDLLHAMLDGGAEIVKFVFEQIHPDEFTHHTSRALAAELLHRFEEGRSVDPASLMNDLTDEQQRRYISDILFNKYHLSKKWDSTAPLAEHDINKIAVDALRVLQRNALAKLVEENQRMMKEASKRHEDIVPYLQRHRELLNVMKEFESKTQSSPS